MARYFTYRSLAGGATLVALVWLFGVRLFAHPAQPTDLVGISELSLLPSDVPIPLQHPLAASRPVPPDPRYVVRKDDNGYHLYFIDGDSYEPVTGAVPRLTASPDPNLDGFTDVLSASGTTTYAIYVRYTGASADSLGPTTSDLYALKDDRIERVLSRVDPVGIGSLDARIPLGGAYLDKRGSLYVMTLSGTLCAIRDGRVVAKSDVTKIGGNRPAIPSMFSDHQNTYFLVPKMLDRDNSMGGWGPKTEAQVRAKYRISRND
jgi:hypothetical protein